MTVAKLLDPLVPGWPPIGPMMASLLEVCTVSGEVCGTPSPELRESLEAAGVTIYDPLHRLPR